MKKIIVLIISILIPLIAAVAISLYGVNYRYEPSANTTTVSEFLSDLNRGIVDCEGRIKNYRKMENYYYEEEPLLKKDIENEEGKRVLTLAIYRNLCIYKPTADAEEKLKTLFEVFVYNVNYDIVKSYFKLDDMEIISKADMPTFTVTFTPTNGKDSFTIELRNRSNVVIPDFDSVPEYANADTKTRNYVQSNIFREYETTNTLSTFSDDANITINASISITNEDKTTTAIEADKAVAEVYLADFQHEGSKMDEKELTVGYREAGVNETYKNAGYYKWLVKNYLWWEALIAFVLVGIITGTFYMVYTTEETNKKTNTKKKRK